MYIKIRFEILGIFILIEFAFFFFKFSKVKVIYPRKIINEN